jgi:transposase InsO family protein
MVRETARLNPLVGYKRLTDLLQNEFAAGLRAHQVYTLLKEEGLLGPCAIRVTGSLRRPALPDAPNQTWHIDLMYLRVNWRWFYLVDIIDAYSRYLVHWTLNPTMESHSVTMTVQEALEKWNLVGNGPSMVHDSGCQFLSKEWKDLVSHHGMPSIRTRIHHPESNGLIERLHRTHRAEALQETEDLSYTQAQEKIAQWAASYNNARPHSALRGLQPVVYYLGDPEAAIAQREHFVQEAAATRANYWQLQRQAVS